MEHDVTLDPQQITLPTTGLWPKLPAIGGAIGVVGLGLAVLLRGEDHHRLAFSYLTGFMFWLTIALGGLFFVILHYLARSGWSVVVRRLAEKVAATLPLFALLFLPIPLLFMHDLFHWSDATAVAHDELLQHKAAYLNVGFFNLRALIYFAAWIGLMLYFNRASRQQDDSADLGITARLNKRSAPAMILFGLTLNYAAVDWMMSLDPHWFSTIFGVYVFAGSVIAIFAILILMCLRLQRRGALEGVVTGEHYHDMGKMLFGFVVFWAYIGFSQFMLIWYANIPEETIWFDHRWHGGWQPVSIFLAVGHFAIPFFWLISQPAKRNRFAMTAGALWLLFMHYVDIYWLVMPTPIPSGEGHSMAAQVFHPAASDVACWLGIGGLFIAYLGYLMRQGSLVPKADPRLAESLTFESV